LRHDLHLAGHAFRIRPVAPADAAFIVDLRSTGGPFINTGAATEAAQRAWIERYFDLPDDYYFLVERNRDDAPQGTVALYDFEPSLRRAQLGRLVLAPGSQAAVETVLLTYRCAFERLGLESVYGRVILGNAAVIAFHDSCGLERMPQPVTILLNGQPVPAVEQVLTRERWPQVEARLDRLASRLAQRG
jgi:RimJ/RimL family protein N-acetyltransferase